MGGGDGEVGWAETLNLLVEEYEADQKRGEMAREGKKLMVYRGLYFVFLDGSPHVSGFDLTRSPYSPYTWGGLVAESMRGCRVEGKQSCWRGRGK